MYARNEKFFALPRRCASTSARVHELSIMSEKLVTMPATTSMPSVRQLASPLCASRRRSEPARSTNWKRDVRTARAPSSCTWSVTNAKQCERLDESFMPVPAVLRDAIAAKTRSASASLSSGSSVWPYSRGGLVVLSIATPIASGQYQPAFCASRGRRS